MVVIPPVAILLVGDCCRMCGCYHKLFLFESEIWLICGTKKKLPVQGNRKKVEEEDILTGGCGRGTSKA